LRRETYGGGTERGEQREERKRRKKRRWAEDDEKLKIEKRTKRNDYSAMLPSPSPKAK
jgi:hypothetical protein